MSIFRVVKKRRPRRLTGLILLMAAVLVISGVLFGMQQRKQKEYNKLATEKRRIENLIAAEERRAEELESYKAYVQTRAYIEQVARDSLGLMYPNEVVFKASAE